MNQVSKILQYIDGRRRCSSEDDENPGIMYSLTNISKVRFGKARSPSSSEPTAPTLTINLEHFDDLSVAKTFSTGDEVGGYLSMELPESTPFDAVSISLEGTLRGQIPS